MMSLRNTLESITAFLKPLKAFRHCYKSSLETVFFLVSNSTMHGNMKNTAYTYLK